MFPTSSARVSRVLAWLAVTSLVCTLFAPAGARAQTEQPAGPAATIGSPREEIHTHRGSEALPGNSPSSAEAARVPTAQADLVLPVGEAPRVDMIALPWDDPSIRVPPSAQFKAAQAAGIDSAAFQIDFLSAGTTDPLNAGRTCLAWPADAQTAFSYAASIWAAQVYSLVPIRIDTCWTNMGSTTILGSSGSSAVRDFLGAPVPGTWYSFSLADKLAGKDLYPSSAADTYITYNSTFAWYFGTDGRTPAGKYDFATVVLHEMGHSLNFSGLMTYGSGCGAPNYGCWSVPGYPGIYDRFIENGSRQPILDTNLFPSPSEALGRELTGDNLYFDGPNANAANSGNRVKIYAPATWSGGSSFSHLDSKTFQGTPNQLMVFSISSASSIHDPGAVTMGLLKDLGWAPTVSINDASVMEGNSGTANANFTVSLSHAAPWPVSINWATAAGTATAGIDYVSASGTATIAAGATSQTITVQVSGDTTYEPDETFYVNLTDAPGAFAFADNQGLGTILNDDLQQAPTVTALISGNTLALTWPFVSADMTYRVYRSTIPYFGPDTTQPLPAENYCAGGATCKYQATTVPTDPNYFYVVRATSSGRTADSNRSGNFKFGLAVP